MKPTMLVVTWVVNKMPRVKNFNTQLEYAKKKGNLKRKELAPKVANSFLVR